LIGIVIVAHGGLAQEYLSAMEHVIGKQEGAIAISIGAECDRKDLPLLIKLGKLRRKPLNEAIEQAITAARKYINCADTVVVKGSRA